jgi:hypothetical protein
VNRRQAWAVAAAIAIAAGAFEPFYLKIFTLDRARFAAGLIELPYRKLPGLRQFLLDVRTHTTKGDVIAVYAPLPQWDNGYDYYYARTLYILAGRRVLPLLDPQNRPQPQNVARAMYIACYHAVPQTSGFEVVWRSRDGALLRRVP